MSDYLIKGETLTGIADAIRAKTGGTDPIMVSDMANQIGNITGGGGSSETVILAESDVAFGDDASGLRLGLISASGLNVVAGKTYRVVFGTDEFTCTAQAASFGADTGIALGNLGLLGIGDLTAEPFIIGVNSTGSICYTTNTDDTVKMAIYEVGSGGSSDDVRYVTFLNYDGSYLGTKAVAVGDDCADPIARGAVKEEDLVKPETAEYKYTYDGWATSLGGEKDANALTAVEEDRTVYAVYKADKQRYVITFLDSDGSVLYSDDWEYGETPAHVPEKDGYTFTGWTPSVVSVTGTATYTATWTKPMVLDDYTWTQLDAMTVDEMKSKFKVGDKKYLNTGMPEYYAVLVGFEKDELADNSGKAKATFITNHVAMVKKTPGLGKYWNNSDTRAVLLDTSNLTGGGYYKLDSAPFVEKGADKILDVAKTVKKKYCANYNSPTTISTANDKFWCPSMTELGYAYDGVPVEGEKYEYFTEKTSASACELFASVDSATRSIYLGSYNNNGFKGWFKLANKVPTISYASGTLNTDVAYPWYGFCI